MDHSNNDCLIVTILSHGDLIPFVHEKTNKEHFTILSHDQMSHVAARDILYPLQIHFSYFTDEKCPSLKNKPKIFLVQACQGTQLDEGFHMLQKRKKTETDSLGFRPLKMKPILPHPDYLIAYSTLPGFYSFRNTNYGSWFIQALCQELRENSSKYDLMKILTFTTQRVAYDFESRSTDIDFDEKKQVSCVVSMLTKLILFFEDEQLNN